MWNYLEGLSYFRGVSGKGVLANPTNHSRSIRHINGQNWFFVACLEPGLD
jgi:endo-beta-N-acetylglucosaminidase D